MYRIYFVEFVYTLSPARTIENLSKAVKPTVAVETKMHNGLIPYETFLSSKPQIWTNLKFGILDQFWPQSLQTKFMKTYFEGVTIQFGSVKILITRNPFERRKISHIVILARRNKWGFIWFENFDKPRIRIRKFIGIPITRDPRTRAGASGPSDAYTPAYHHWSYNETHRNFCYR